jgi:hypothetical protein
MMMKNQETDKEINAWEPPYNFTPENPSLACLSAAFEDAVIRAQETGEHYAGVFIACGYYDLRD